MRCLVASMCVCLIFINCMIWVKVDRKQKELEFETQVKLLQMEERNERQDKELRLLKQDVDIIENGYRE